MTPADFVATVVDPGLAFLGRISGILPDSRPRLVLTATACQESGLVRRCQEEGPARGWWQMERGGGVRGVLNHPRSAVLAAKVCAELCIPTDEATVYEAMAWSDNLSVAFARLLLWTDPTPLPELGAIDECWNCYLGLWRPGKPSRERWTQSYQDAISIIRPAVAENRIAPIRRTFSSVKSYLDRLSRPRQ